MSHCIGINLHASYSTLPFMEVNVVVLTMPIRIRFVKWLDFNHSAGIYILVSVFYSFFFLNLETHVSSPLVRNMQ